MKQNQQFRGMGLILLVMALIFFASTLSQQGNLFSDEMTYQEFMTSVENGDRDGPDPPERPDAHRRRNDDPDKWRTRKDRRV